MEVLAKTEVLFFVLQSIGLPLVVVGTGSGEAGEVRVCGADEPTESEGGSGRVTGIVGTGAGAVMV